MSQLVDDIERRLALPPPAGRIRTDTGELRWSANGVWLDEVRLERPAVQLSREPVAPRTGWRRLWPWTRRPRLLVEVRGRTSRVRLAARVPQARLEGLAELDLAGPAVMPGAQLLDLLHAVRAADGRFLVASPRPATALPVPEIEPPGDDGAPDEPPPQRARIVAALRRRLDSLRGGWSTLGRRLRGGLAAAGGKRRAAVLRCWRLALGLQPMVVLPMFAARLGDAPLPGLTSLSMRALVPVGFVLVSGLGAAAYAGVQHLRGRLDALETGAATGFGLGLAAVSMWVSEIVWSFMDFGNGIGGWMLAMVGMFATLFALRLTGAMTGDDASNSGAFAPYMAMVALPGPHWLFYLPGGVLLATRFGAKLGAPEDYAAREQARELAEERERRRRRGF